MDCDGNGGGFDDSLQHLSDGCFDFRVAVLFDQSWHHCLYQFGRQPQSILRHFFVGGRLGDGQARE